jgi:hypothetical protein
MYTHPSQQEDDQTFSKTLPYYDNPSKDLPPSQKDISEPSTLFYEPLYDMKYSPFYRQDEHTGRKPAFYDISDSQGTAGKKNFYHSKE